MGGNTSEQLCRAVQRGGLAWLVVELVTSRIASSKGISAPLTGTAQQRSSAAGYCSITLRKQRANLYSIVIINYF